MGQPLQVSAKLSQVICRISQSGPFQISLNEPRTAFPAHSTLFPEQVLHGKTSPPELMYARPRPLMHRRVAKTIVSRKLKTLPEHTPRVWSLTRSHCSSAIQNSAARSTSAVVLASSR